MIDVLRDIMIDAWVRVKFAFRNGYAAFMDTLAPEYRWESKMDELNPIVAFPEKIVFKEVKEEGHVGFLVISPNTYGVSAFYPETSVEPRRRAIRDCFILLADFIETDQINQLDFEVVFESDPEIEKPQEKAFTVATSEEDVDAP